MCHHLPTQFSEAAQFFKVVDYPLPLLLRYLKVGQLIDPLLVTSIGRVREF